MAAEISFGFLLIPLQLLDMAGPMDFLANISSEMCGLFGPPELAKRAPKINFHHIGPTMEPVRLSAAFQAQPTTTIKDCPKLDYLLIGGPAPDYFKNLPADMKAFIIERSKEVRTIFTVCTGGGVLAATGLLDGLSATMNHTLIPDGEAVAPKVKWDSQSKWVIDGDGKYWTAAGAIAGMDMIAMWVEQEYGREFRNFSTMLLEYQPRDVSGKHLGCMNGRGEMISA